ncbi:MAG: TlyA family RNA methyltransferase [Pseudomonadota bacterium]
MRLDVWLEAEGRVPSRARARDLVRQGAVSINGAVETKPSRTVPPGATVQLDSAASRYVSRAAQKLIAGLDHFGFDPSGMMALDVGASTGGFTQVLLDRGAARIYAVDVGRDQLHRTLRQDPRVVSLEATDARALDDTIIPVPVQMIVSDVSFISLTKALPRALTFAAPGAVLLALVKPQFEVGRERIGKGGIVRDAAARNDAIEAVCAFVDGTPGWQVIGTAPSPLSGGDGNLESLIGARFAP